MLYFGANWADINLVVHRVIMIVQYMYMQLSVSSFPVFFPKRFRTIAKPPHTRRLIMGKEVEIKQILIQYCLIRHGMTILY